MTVCREAVISGPCRAELVEVDEPKAKENWVVVKVHAAPTCTEYKSFVSGVPSQFLGHQAAGEVVEIAQPGRVKVGDRVVLMPLYACGKCQLCVTGDYIHCESGTRVAGFTAVLEGSATYSQYLLKPDWLLPSIPEGVPYDSASLACCALGPSFGAFNLMGVGALDSVLITGLGPVGLGAVVNARFLGARVIAVESNAYRVDRALAMGASAVFDPRDDGTVARIRELTGGFGVDCALDCSRTVGAERRCIDTTRRKGQVSFVGECNDDLRIRVSPDMIRKGLTVRGPWHYNLRLFPSIIKVIQESPLIDEPASHVLPMSDIQSAFELSSSNQTAKVILNPWE